MRQPEFWARDGLLPRLLEPAALLWSAGGALRWAFANPWRAPVPVVCVGNLVAGGAGKTPVAIAVARALAELGIHAHFLTRGYGGESVGPLRVDPARHKAQDVGDEPLLLARAGPCWVASDRAAGARAAVDAGAAALVMDDGFQNPGLAKDLSVVVVDGGFGFGNGRVIPAGPLRETVKSGLARADAAVIVGDDERDAAAALAGIALLRARLEPLEPARFRARRLLAFAGIGRPEKFFATLRALGADLVATHGFADHHPYAEAELTPLLAEASAKHAALVTTAKDAVRLPQSLRDVIEVLEVAIAWDDPAAFYGLLRRFVVSRAA